MVHHDGSLWTTGFNGYGQLGDGTTTNRYTFVKVIDSGVQAMTGGWLHTIVMKQDGSLWTTGYNENGELGDGTTTSRSTFVKVSTTT